MAAADVAIVRALAAKQLGVGENHVSDSLLSYLTGILSSRLAPSVVANEDHVADRIRKRLVRADASHTQALKFEKLHRLLAAKVAPRDRWAILTLMLSVAEQGEVPGAALPLQSAFSDNGLRSLPSSSLPAVARAPAPAPAPGPLPAFTRYVADNLSGVSEAALLRDLLYVFQGVDGKYIRWDATADAYVVDPRASMAESTRALVVRLCEVGWRHRRITDMLSKRRRDPTFGLVGQCFLVAMGDELSEYQRLVVVLEAQLLDAQADGAATAAAEGGSRGLTLNRLLVWMVDPIERLKILAVIAECCQEHKGGALISSVYRYTRHGDPAVASLVERLLEKICMPFFDMLVQWIQDGTLVDPLSEFMVAVAQGAGAADADPWAQKYVIRESMVPVFFTPALTNNVLLAGKSINFVRDVCRDTRWTLPFTIHREDLRYSQLSRLAAAVEAAKMSCSRRLLDLLFDEHALVDHLRALRQYLLLGQGDFIQVLMDQLAGDLDRPAPMLLTHSVVAKLETAVRASNAQYDSADVLRRLNARLLRASPGNTGWDIFTLEYHLDPPLTSIVHERGSKQLYLRLFGVLWRLKRTQHALEMAWREQLGFGGGAHLVVEMRHELHHCHILRAHMFHFISQLQYYIMFEVLECSWDELNETLQRRDEPDLDKVIAAHERYISGIAAKLLLSESSQSLLETLFGLFDVIARFRTAQGGLYTVLAGELERRKQLRRDAVTRTKAGRWGITAMDRAESMPPEVRQGPVRDARRQLGQVSEEYHAALGQFFVGLNAQADDALRSLRSRLDFNGYYARTGALPQATAKHQQQQQQQQQQK